MADQRGARLFADINSCFRRDPLIDEYDFLPVTEPKHNKSPLVVVEHKLGLEAWCVKILFRYCYDRLLDWRSREGQAKFAHPQEVSGLSRAVLLIQPDCYTVWNIRKDLVEYGDVTIADDLNLGSLILSKHPKSAETFIHRRWLLHKLLNQCLASSNDSNTSNNSCQQDGCVNMDAIGVDLLPQVDNHAHNNHMLQVAVDRDVQGQIQQELSVCRRAADRYPCNYHAWSHRIWTLQHCYHCSIRVLLAELHATQSWAANHISDHSGFHYRQFILNQLLQQADILRDKFCTDAHNLLERELELILDLINSYPGHEALWYHRKFVFHSLHHSLSKTVKSSSHSQHISLLDKNGSLCSHDNHGTSYTDEHKGQKKFKSENNEQQGLVLRELDSVSHKTAPDSHTNHLATRYKEWIQQCFSH
ncbi:protein prenyltransferase alpha subunit repeat-containing protein 1-like [Haliotis cracherodii]|uniref:protein prenyltransferase alpha subunit repeat-containing protein 1-like n=1 Tax=Haliotis cracherodii TaxID=6455 RepID=UPI0039EC2402